MQYAGSLDILSPIATGPTIPIPLFEYGVSAGLPEGVTDRIERTIDLNSELVVNRHTTFCVRVNGQSMIDAQIDHGDLLIVDRSLEAKDQSIVLAVIDGDFTVKRLEKQGHRLFLKPENNQFKPIEITEFSEFRVWGVVTGVIKRFA